MRGAGHVEEKPIAARLRVRSSACSLTADKNVCGMPAAYSIFRKTCRVVADSETWPNAAAVARFPRNGVSVNSTNALPCFSFIDCDCGHLGRSVDPVASLLVKSGFCRIRFWYAVAPGFWYFQGNQSQLLLESHSRSAGDRACSATAAASRRAYWRHLGPGILPHYRSPLSKRVADSYAACSRFASRTWRSCSPTMCLGT
jgi:hypothetical protein